MKKSYYNLKGNDVLAKAYNCPISMKFSIELAREIRDKPYKKVLKYLDDIIELKRHVPLKRYNQDVAHRKGPAISGVKSGRFPVKVAKYFKKVLLMAKSNADYKGLDSDKKDLIVKGCVISQGMKRYNFQTKGKRRLRRDQTASIEIVLVQQGKFVKKAEKPAEKKTEAKKESVEDKVENKTQKEKVEEHKKTLAREMQRSAKGIDKN